MQKTNIGLVQHSEKALAEKWGYMWGSFGQISTKAVIDSNIRQYPTNEKWRSYLQKSIGKTRLCDCYGLVKGYLWWAGDTTNPKYNVAQDTNTAGAYQKAKEKGTLATLPEVKGVILYMQGHVAVYCGNGKFIELMGGGVGAYEGKIVNGKITKGSKFTHWFKDININYNPIPPTPPKPVAPPTPPKEEAVMSIKKIDLDIEGKKVKVDSVNINNMNYISARQILENLGYTVTYDDKTKTTFAKK